MDADSLAWAYLLREGCVYNKWEFYGGRYDEMPRKTAECLKGIGEVGIDWNKTEGPRDNMESEFQDTFSDPVYVKTMTGILVLRDGRKFKWGCNWEEPRNVFEVVAAFAYVGSAEEVAYNRLKKNGELD